MVFEGWQFDLEWIAAMVLAATLAVFLIYLITHKR